MKAEAVWASLFWQILAGLAIASVAAWAWILRRWMNGLPLLPYAARKHVSWGWVEVLLILFVFEVPFLQALLPPLVQSTDAVLQVEKHNGVSFEQRQDQSTLSATSGSVDEDLQDSDQQAGISRRVHPVLILLHQDRSLGTFLLCLVMAGVMAPFCEELIFRLVLQGWLARQEYWLHRACGSVRRLPFGALSIGLTSFLFAIHHLRIVDPTLPPPDPKQVKLVLQGLFFYQTMLVTFVLVVLVVGAGARLSDFGLGPGRFVRDVKAGVVAVAALTAPLMGLEAVLAGQVLPETIAPDPIPIFVLSLALGYLYQQTGGIIAPITLHMLFNLVSLVLAEVAIRGNLAL